jgi:hypothetical protein
MKITVLWLVTSWSLLDMDVRIGGIFFLHYQGECTYIMNVKAIGLFLTWILTYQTTRRHIPKTVTLYDE